MSPSRIAHVRGPSTHSKRAAAASDARPDPLSSSAPDPCPPAASSFASARSPAPPAGAAEAAAASEDALRFLLRGGAPPGDALAEAAPRRTGRRPPMMSAVSVCAWQLITCRRLRRSVAKIWQTVVFPQPVSPTSSTGSLFARQRPTRRKSRRMADVSAMSPSPAAAAPPAPSSAGPRPSSCCGSPSSASSGSGRAGSQAGAAGSGAPMVSRSRRSRLPRGR